VFLLLFIRQPRRSCISLINTRDNYTGTDAICRVSCRGKPHDVSWRLILSVSDGFQPTAAFVPGFPCIVFLADKPCRGDTSAFNKKWRFQRLNYCPGGFPFSSRDEPNDIKMNCAANNAVYGIQQVCLRLFSILVR